MTELMKRPSELQPVTVPQFVVNEYNQLKLENIALKDQLRWRPVSEKPEKCGQISLKRIENGVDSNELTWFYFLESLDEFDIVVNTLGATHWLPIPPAPEGEVK